MITDIQVFVLPDKDRLEIHADGRVIHRAQDSTEPYATETDITSTRLGQFLLSIICSLGQAPQRYVNERNEHATKRFDDRTEQTLLDSAAPSTCPDGDEEVEIPKSKALKLED